jgi:hypothetical protein
MENIKSKKKKVLESKESKVSKASNNENNITITDDKMINEVLGNIGKKTNDPVKKALVNNFINEKKNDIKKVVKKTHQKSNPLNNNTSNTNQDIDDEKRTYTSNLTKEEINEKLQDYKLVDDISKVPIGTHLRYFVIKNGVKLFRMGGNLKRNLDLPKFVVLVNALGTEWTVQIKDTTFYKKMLLSEIKDEYDNIIEELHEKIKKYKSKIEEKDNVISELQDTIKKFKSK